MSKNLETGGEKPFNGKNTLVQPDSGREARTEQEQFPNQGELGTMQQQLALKSVEAVQKLLAQVFISCWLTTELKSGRTTGWLNLGLCAHKKQHSDRVKAHLSSKKIHTTLSSVHGQRWSVKFVELLFHWVPTSVYLNGSVQRNVKLTTSRFVSFSSSHK